MRIKRIKKQIIKNEKLAELLGVIAGDGHLQVYKSKKRSSYAIVITGNKTEDIDYFEFLRNLIKDIFDEDSKIYNKKDGIYLKLWSKEIVELINVLGIPIGNKSHILKTPGWIKPDTNFIKSFIRGLADTDFCITFKKGDRRRNSYPVITGYFSSYKLASEVSQFLKGIGVSGNLYKETNDYFGTNSVQYRLDINGVENLYRWMNTIGFNNPKHMTKFLVWEKYGYLLPNTTIQQRKNLLKVRNS